MKPHPVNSHKRNTSHTARRRWRWLLTSGGLLCLGCHMQIAFKSAAPYAPFTLLKSSQGRGGGRFSQRGPAFLVRLLDPELPPWMFPGGAGDLASPAGGWLEKAAPPPQGARVSEPSKGEGRGVPLAPRLELDPASACCLSGRPRALAYRPVSLTSFASPARDGLLVHLPTAALRGERRSRFLCLKCIPPPTSDKSYYY